MKPKVTIKEIAKECGVSITTVSRVMNNIEGSCSLETENKIKTAIKKLGYHPNPVARSLVTKRTNIIGIIIPDISNFFFQDFAKGAEKILNKKKYRLVLCSTEGSKDKEDSFLLSLSNGFADGIIVTTQNAEEEDDNIVYLNNKKFPIIAVERYGEIIKDVASATLDNAMGLYLAMKSLVENGHEKIAFIAGPENAHNANLRKAGYLKAIHDFNLKMDEDLIIHGDYKIESGYQCMKDLLKNKKFTAFVAANDLMAIGACRAIREAGMSIPEDISAIGFDGTILAELHQPPLTTISIHGEEMGKIAATNLIKLIEGKKLKQKHEIVKSEIKQGGSVKKLNKVSV